MLARFFQQTSAFVHPGIIPFALHLPQRQQLMAQELSRPSTNVPFENTWLSDSGGETSVYNGCGYAYRKVI